MARHVLPAGGHDRLDDVVVAGAAADIAFEILADLGLGRLGVSFSSAAADITMPGVQKPHCRP
jgi:hypothetical protein